MGTHDKLTQRYQDLKILNDESCTRFCYPVSSDELVFKGIHESTPRGVGEILSVAEETFGGKFSMAVDTDSQHALETLNDRTTPHRAGPLATIEVWSLEPGSYDLVLKLPHHATSNKDQLNALVEQFIDRARNISNRIDSLDHLRFEAGPGMNLPKAQSVLRKLEQRSGTQLDTETLLSFLRLDEPQLEN